MVRLSTFGSTFAHTSSLYCFLYLNFQLKSCHGWRTIENLKRFIPSIPDEELPEKVKIFESRISQIADESRKKGNSKGQIIAMPGAKQLLEEVRSSIVQLFPPLGI